MTERRYTVVGAVIVEDGHLLAARRTKPPELAGFWEFPGGKVEPDEDPRDALAREIREELSACIVVGEEVLNQGEPWPISRTYELRLFLATIDAGPIVPGADHDEIAWLDLRDLSSVRWLSSDRQALDAVIQALG